MFKMYKIFFTQIFVGILAYIVCSILVFASLILSNISTGKTNCKMSDIFVSLYIFNNK